eukprot:SAG22_NODE_2281_length_2760_cov_21.201052_2_plen_87_part_00
MAVRSALFIEPSGRLTRRRCSFIAPEPRHPPEQTGWRFGDVAIDDTGGALHPPAAAAPLCPDQLLHPTGLPPTLAPEQRLAWVWQQ